MMNSKLLDIKFIRKFDRENMLGLLMSFPKQCERAMHIGRSLAIDKKYKKDYKIIAFLGLGGSAIGADLIRSYLLDECNIPIYVVRDYTLPKFVDKESLVFAVSYSGDTEETISAYNEANKRGSDIIVIASGGKLEKMAKRDRHLLVSIPKGLPPRCALGYTFIPALSVLSRLEIIRDQVKDLKDAISCLEKLSEQLKPDARLNISKRIASYLFGAFPVIYASTKPMDVVAVRWRSQIAENAKTLSSIHTYPEMNHNEIVGWVNPYRLLRKFVVITLKDKNDHPRIKKRMAITNAILRKTKFRVMEIDSRGDSLLSRMLSLIYIGDFVSFYLAIMYKINPTPVERISYLKKQLSKK